MSEKQEAWIFLAEKRKQLQTEGARVFKTLNVEPFWLIEGLAAWNDVTLAPGHEYAQSDTRSVRVIILPIIGAVEVTISGRRKRIDVGELLEFESIQHQMYSVMNPYQEELVNFLEIRIPCLSASSSVYFISFDIEKNNVLQKLINFRGGLWLGKFDGRFETEVIVDASEKGVFVFVVEGAFEVEKRLMHARDALFLKHYESIELEALSNEAVLIIYKF